MIVRWTRPALGEFAEILRYIRKDDPAAAARVKARIAETVASLATMENRGRLGEVDGTRELIFSPWPYIVVYQVSERQVHVLTVRHGAQSWPVQ